jgi:LPS-assembly lipoprotein
MKIKYAVALLVSLMMGACGFQLRQAPDFLFKTLYSTFPEASPLAQEIRRNIEGEVIADSKQIERADVIFELLQELPQKVILARTSTGLVRDFQLILRVTFRLRARDGTELIPATEIIQQRDISFNDSAALSKESEEQLLYRDMRSDIVQQIMRRISAVRKQ